MKKFYVESPKFVVFSLGTADVVRTSTITCEDDNIGCLRETWGVDPTDAVEGNGGENND